MGGGPKKIDRSEAWTIVALGSEREEDGEGEDEGDVCIWEPAQPRAVVCCSVLWSCLIDRLMDHERKPQTLERMAVKG